MRREIFTVTLPWGETFRFVANLAEASAPIYTLDDDDPDDPDNGSQTQWQTADARHCEREAAMLLMDRSDVAAIEEREGLDEAAARAWISEPIRVEAAEV